MFDILGAVGSVLSGGATGIIGVAVQRYFDLKAEEQKTLQMDKQLVHDVSMKELDMKIAAQEWAGKTQVATVEGATALAVKAEESFSTSLTNEPKKYSEGAAYTQAQAWLMVLLDFIRGIVRPSLTVYLCVLTTLVYQEGQALLNKATLTVDQAFQNNTLVINTILYLTTTCVLWWFGTRNQQKPPKTR